jgi:uncharacterized sulfatase
MDKPYSKLWLYDLASDPTEKTNLVASNGAETSTLLKELRGISATQHAPIWPSLALVPEAIDHPLSYPDSPNDEMIFWAN